MPEDGEVQLTLARSLLANGQVRRAEPIVRTLVSRFPHSAAALATLGSLQARSGNDSGGAEVVCAARSNSIRPASMPWRGWRSLDIAEKRPDAARARADAFLEQVPRERAGASCSPRASMARRATGREPRRS